MLNEALERLSERERNAVILHYLQNQKLHEVSHTLGISEEAAKKRVSRGLERLRAFFVQHGFHASASTLAALFIAHGTEDVSAEVTRAVSSAAIAQGSTAKVALPRLVKETEAAWRWIKVKWAAGLGITAVALVLLVSSWSPRNHKPNDAANKTNSTKPALVASATGISRIAVKNQTPNKAATGKQLAFRVVDAQTSLGLAGAKVRALFWKGWQVEPLEDLVTDQQGWCHLPLPEQELGRLDVRALLPGYVKKAMMWQVTKGEFIPEKYEMKLDRGMTIGGWVQDEMGVPIEGAQLRILLFYTSRPNPQVSSRNEFNFPEDIPVAQTDQKGQWLFSSMPSDLKDCSLMIGVKHIAFLSSDFSSHTRQFTAGNPKQLSWSELLAGNSVIVLKRGFSLAGVVTDLQQNPVPKAKIRLGQAAENAISSAITGSNGHFVLTNVPPNPLPLTIIAEGFAPEQVQITGTAEVSPLKIQLKPGGLLKLRVVDGTGAAMVGTRVILERWRANQSLEWADTTDDQGRVEWRSAPTDTLNLVAFKDGYLYSRGNLVVADGQEHTLILRPVLKVSGWVIDGLTREPMRSFKVVAGFGSMPVSVWDRHTLIQGEHGQYTITLTEDDPPYRLQVEAEGYKPAAKTLTSESTEVICNFELKRLDQPQTPSRVQPPKD